LSAVLLGKVFENYDLLAWLRRLRQRRLEAYGVALLVVALATLLRMLLWGVVSEAGPFTIYSLAIIIAALVCGFWPGMMATVLSVLIGSYFFVPPTFSFALFSTKEAWTVTMFAVVASINVALVSGLVAVLLRHEDRQLLLFRELQHRSQNLFAVIQAIASRTLIEGQTIANAKEVFAGRLHALARTHSMLANNAFLGAPLKEIVAQELTSFSDQVTVTGCDIAVNTRAAESFALIIHELATNAVKYGALSTRQGRVAIQCSIVDGANGRGQLRFEWRESGGPPVSPPTSKGFGSTILFEVAKQFSQDVQAKFSPEGFTYQLRSLLTAIEAPGGEYPASRAAAAAEPQERAV
jgi:two-component sensor histidine kinase